MNKKTLKWIFIALAILVAVIVIWYFFLRQPPVPKPAEPVPSGSPTPSWASESFPLNIGMYGNKIKALQAALGITADGKFGSQTNAAIVAAGYSVPLSQDDYNKIMTDKDASNPIGKVAYSKIDGLKVYKVSDNSVYKTVNRDGYVGVISGEYAGSGSYWLISSGLYKVYKDSIYTK